MFYPLNVASTTSGRTSRLHLSKTSVLSTPIISYLPRTVYLCPIISEKVYRDGFAYGLPPPTQVLSPRPDQDPVVP